MENVPLTTSPFPYHLELPLIPPNEATFERHRNEDVLFGLKAETVDDLSYDDQFFDTAAFDLHASSQLMRARSIHRRGSFKRYLEYKNICGYVQQLFLARKYGICSVGNDADLERYLSWKAPCEPMQFFAQDRPDLAGLQLQKSVDLKVEKRIKFIYDESTQLSVHLSFHRYKFLSRSQSVGGILIEIKPLFLSDIQSSYLAENSAVLASFLKCDYTIDPPMKYQRAPRNILMA